MTKPVTLEEVRKLPDLVTGSNFLVEFPAYDGVERDEEEESLWRQLTVLCNALRIAEVNGKIEVELCFYLTMDTQAIRKLISVGKRVPFMMKATLLDTTGKAVYWHHLELDRQRIIPRADWKADTKMRNPETITLRYQAQGLVYMFTE